MKRVLIISGCNISLTPVVASYLNYLKKIKVECDVIEYAGFRRIKFIFQSIKAIIFGEYLKIICVNQQALPMLVFACYFTKVDLIYWKLESYKLFENSSIALNIQILEYLLIKKNISLVVPTRFRADIQKPIFKKLFVVQNAPLDPYQKQGLQRRWNEKNISLVIYGNINKKNEIFLDEWISFVNSSNRFTLSIIGASSESTDKVKFKGRLNHEVLINDLCDLEKYNFSIVGYENTGQNTKYSAPNKLIESLACGIPVIGHIGNPYIVEIISKYSCGILFDFNCLNDFSLNITNQDYLKLSNYSMRAADELCLSNTIKNTALDIA